ncbi:hypothetical protein HYFRA_00006776 [Hymenoscyphus fraxineus]|uniref:Histone-lysine N-methyltransferase, H3 lysine-9 specific dim-5 n=1 Tax=Hymenoscyphus fraxineus TaxID=746836 RepID=A0A9N9PFE3_9HELO|nr:hypothetical protein HYFRA_00006776 [Hymenoscyphus fraxineus]
MMREAYVRHFKSHPGLENGFDPTCHWCQISTFTTHLTAHISIVNRVDDMTLPPDFVFIQHAQPGKDIELPDPAFFSGCECKKAATCKSARCSCLQDMTVLDAKNADVYVYRAESGGYVMRDEYLETREPIYECHESCKCEGEACPNRVVGRGRTVPLQIFRTSDGRGWGVRALQPIRKGQFIDLYVGEILTAAETEIRRKHSAITQKKDVYLFELDKFKSDADRDPSLANTVFVDGEFRSGPTRFINHSCDPNLRIFARVGDHATKRFHDLAFFAIKDIGLEEELTFDYVDGEDEKLEEEKRNPLQKREMTRCLCKSRKCRGYLW